MYMTVADLIDALNALPEEVRDRALVTIGRWDPDTRAELVLPIVKGGLEYRPDLHSVIFWRNGNG